MNKSKKIAVAAVSVVMAGTMVVSLAGCKKDSGKKWHNPEGSNQTKLDVSLENGKLSWADDTNIVTYIGHQNMDMGTNYDNSDNSIKLLTNYLGGTSGTTLYGNNYSATQLKPAWQALADQLKVTFTDKYDGSQSKDQYKYVSGSTLGLANVDIFTSSASDINNGASADGEAILDLTKYLDYMPNYKAFLDANPLVRLSLTASTNGAMYLAPYFDGNDDIEKYVLLRKDIVEDLLNATGSLSGTVTYKTQANAKETAADGTTAYATAFMGSDNWEIEVTDPSVLTGTPKKGNDKAEVTDSSKTIKITVDYTKALADAKSSEAGTIGAILKTAGVADADIAAQTSGNIIDIMNLVINKKAGEVNGDTLTQILRRYITVTYIFNNESFYTTGGRKLSEVFNSAYAAWDADLYTALGRCYTTSGTALGEKVKGTKDLFLFTGRQNRTDRFNDTVAMAGELYGVRGLESRYQYSYIKEDGTLIDARTKEETFEAVNRMNALTKEGLFFPLSVATKSNLVNGESSHSGTAFNKDGIQTLSLHDYVQTQTANQGFRGGSNDPYNFAPVLTAVSKWDTDDNGSHETVMRFTESWRSVKTTGFAVSYKAVRNNPDKLAACLGFIDYMFSGDGQLLMTYGPQSMNGNDDGSIEATKAAGNGFWYAEKQTSLKPSDVATKVADATNYAPAQWVMKEGKDTDGKKFVEKYFIYKDEVYTGTFYNGRQIPTLTASNLAMFHSGSVGKNSFTNYARRVIGTTLPIGNKDQGFEYQCTANCGVVGADIVAIALNNGTIKHPVQQVPGMDDNKLGNWYTLVPVTLFYESDVLTELVGETADVVTGFTSKTHIFVNGSDSAGNFFHDIMSYGLGSGHAITLMKTSNLPANAADCVSFLNNYKMDTFNKEMNIAFQELVNVYVK